MIEADHFSTSRVIPGVRIEGEATFSLFGGAGRGIQEANGGDPACKESKEADDSDEKRTPRLSK